MDDNCHFVARMLCLFTFIFSFSGGCDTKNDHSRTEPAKRNEIRLGIVTWAGFGAGVVGMEKGFFPDLDVQTKILDDMPARHAAFQSGALEIMISSVDGFAQEASQGVPGKVVFITDESWGGDGIVCKKDIASVKDFRGRKVAFARSTPSHYLLLRAIANAGLKISDIEQVQVDDPGRAADAFLAGSVDVAVTWEPFLTNTAKSGKGKILLTTKDYPDMVVDCLVASEKFATDDKQLRQFMDGWLKSVDYIKEHPDEAAAVMAKGLNIPVDDVKGMMAGLRFADRERNRHFFDKAVPAGSRIASLLEEAGAYWKSIDIVKTPVKGASRISPSACRYFNPN